MTDQKTKPTQVPVIDFINSINHERKRKEGLIILGLMKNICGMEPRMWGPSIIGFGKYHYKYDSGHEGEAALLAFSPRKANHVLYILSESKEQEELLQKLGKYKVGKVCLYINKLADIDIEVLKELISTAWNHVKNR